jgi:hypothetical protein
MQSPNSPLHERLPPLGSVRRIMRKALFSFLEKVAHTDEARQIAADALVGLSPSESWDAVTGLRNSAPPYPELHHRLRNGGSAKRDDAIIITARFRSGSTLLWNLFRNVDGVTVYYEPFNERRWFDPATRGNRVDASHHGIAEYWREYDGLEKLGRYYREEWTYRNLFMGANFWNPQMKAYIEILIEKAPGRPVLQFNRIDFRLPWIRQNFPLAKIVHLYRNPRDQWCSSLLELKYVSQNAGMDEFRDYDKFYLMTWARDLKYHFPFLDERTISHPYQLFYYIWKLSYLFGVKYADSSIPYELLVKKPETQLGQLFRALNIQDYDLDKLNNLVVNIDTGKWREYADDAWFKKHESGCEDVLTEFLSAFRADAKNDDSAHQ